MNPLNGENSFYNLRERNTKLMLKARTKSAPESGRFPKTEPITDSSRRLLSNLPANRDIAKPVLVGLLSVEPSDSLYEELAMKAACSTHVRDSLFEIAGNHVLDEFVRANAAYVLGTLSKLRRYNISRGNRAFERLLHSDDFEIRYCGAYALLHASVNYLMPRSVGKMAELLTDERFSQAAAKILLRELSTSPQLMPKHEPLVDILEKNHCPDICKDNPPLFVLRLRVLSELERLSA